MRELTPSEEKSLAAFLKALYKINPSLHNNLSCMKRTVSLLGYYDGVYLLMLAVFLKLRIIYKSFKSETSSKINRLNIWQNI